jgi:hypothetical protein
MKRIASILVLISMAALSCLNPFSPASVDPSGTKPILQQDDVSAVLSNFKYAYEHNDIDVYENCLDPGFIFSYTDQNLAGEIETIEVPRDGPSGDLERTARLFNFFDEIRLDTWMPQRVGGEQVGSETWEIYNVFFQLSVRDIDGDFGGESFEAVGFAEFKFRISKDDGLWRIIYWEDRSSI